MKSSDHLSASSDSNPRRAGELAQSIVDILVDETPATRGLAIKAAMTLLGDVIPTLDSTRVAGTLDRHEAPSELDSGRFFNRGEKLKPAENAHLCAAFHYSQYGSVPFTLDEIRTIGAEAGVVLPDRLDMTFSSATNGGKKLFQPAGRSTFKPTSSAGITFDEKWNVKPGRKTKNS
jgi:hypothetical protein